MVGGALCGETEAVLISGRKIVEKIEMTIKGTRNESKRAIKYLGVIINDRLNFKEHVKFIGGKASATGSTDEDDAKYRSRCCNIFFHVTFKKF